MTTQKQMIERERRQDSALPRRRLTETAVAGGSAAILALFTALLMPFGPVTSAQVWLVMASCLVIGLIAGLALRTPWAMLLAPLVYIVAFELFRSHGGAAQSGPGMVQ